VFIHRVTTGSASTSSTTTPCIAEAAGWSRSSHAITRAAPKSNASLVYPIQCRLMREESAPVARATASVVATMATSALM
jgi:hypothetical protein